MSRKRSQFGFRATEADKRRWEQAAAKDGRSLSSWIRQICNQAAMPKADLEALVANARRKR